MSPILSVENICCDYGNQKVIEDLSFTLNQGEIGCLLGPSGCGKSTILKAISGFESVTSGVIKLNDSTISTANHTLAPEKRNIGMVFQDYALFPHLNIADNIGFGICQKKKQERNHIISEMLSLVELEHYRQRFPHELSGGEQQRVSLARALATEPKLLLLDEPFSSLDASMRSRLSLDIRSILKRLDITCILVTHDQREAFMMSDRIGVIEKGTVQQWAHPYEIYHEPFNQFTANFMGRGVYISGTSLSKDTFSTKLGIFKGNRAYNWSTNSDVEILIRPDDVVYSPCSELKGKITEKTFAGASTLYKLTFPSGEEVEALFPSHRDYRIGDIVPVKLDTEHLIVYKKNNPV